MASSVTLSRSAEETFQLGKKFASGLKTGDVVALFGPLGGGKTTFVKGIVAGLGALGPVTSPTFVLLNVYSLDSPQLRSEQAASSTALVHATLHSEASERVNASGTSRDKSGKIAIYHFDFYRLEQPSQLQALNLDDYLFGPGICLIEWPELVLPMLDHPFYEVRFEMVGEGERRIEIKRAG